MGPGDSPIINGDETAAISADCEPFMWYFLQDRQIVGKDFAYAIYY